MKRWMGMILFGAMLLSIAFSGCALGEGNQEEQEPGDSQEEMLKPPKKLQATQPDKKEEVSKSEQEDPKEEESSEEETVSGEVPSVSELLTDSALSASQPVTGASALEGLDNTKMGWGQGYQVNDQNQPVGSVTYQEKYGQYGAYFIAPTEPVVYLTFDEGYENGYTSQILDVLKEKQVSAVFFVTMPYVKAQPDLIRRMIDEGHVVGNHSVNHPSFPTQDLATCEKEIMDLHQYMLEEFDYEMKLFRYPMGEFSQRTLALTQSLGYHSVFWSFAYQDWNVDAQPDPQAAFDRITQAVHPGAIYLLHAVSSTNTQVLGDVIDNIRAQGYTFGKFDLSGIPSQGNSTTEGAGEDPGAAQEEPSAAQGDSPDGDTSSSTEPPSEEDKGGRLTIRKPSSQTSQPEQEPETEGSSAGGKLLLGRGE